jgi:hypothetical protein
MFGNIIEQVNEESLSGESIADEDFSTNKIPPIMAVIPTSGRITVIIDGGGGGGSIGVRIRIG